MEPRRPLPLEHWGLACWPFQAAPRVDQLYPTVGSTEALARIEYLVNGRRRLGMLLGEAGVGKSLVLRTAARQLARQGHAVALVEALGITSRELLWQTAASFGAAPDEDADMAVLWRRIADRVAENRLQQVHTVLLVDDAGQAGADVLTQFVRLARLDPSPFPSPNWGGVRGGARWTIVLAAEPAQAVHWNETLRGLVDLRIDLPAWDLQETIGYVQTALVDAGRIEPLFEDDALALVHELTQGIPRQIARLADFALLAGAAAELETIDRSTVDAAHDEIAWPTAAAVF